MSDKPHGYSAAAYVALLPRLQTTARSWGYALAVHGSLNRDMDLIAIPWIEEAAASEYLIYRLWVTVGILGEASIPRGPLLRPHGRASWQICLPLGASLDISVTQPLRPKQKTCPVCTGTRSVKYYGTSYSCFVCTKPIQQET